MVNILGYVEKTTYEIYREDIEALIIENPGAVLVTAGLGLLAVVVYRATTSLSSSVQALRSDVGSLTESSNRMGVAIEGARDSMAQGLRQIEERVQANVDVLVDRTNEVGTRIDTLNGATAQGFITLGEGNIHLQTSVNTQGQRLDGIRTSINTQGQRLDEIRTSVNTQGELLDEIQDTINDIGDGIGEVVSSATQNARAVSSIAPLLNHGSSSCQSVGAPGSSSYSSHQSAGGPSSSNLRSNFFSPPSIPGSGSARSSIGTPTANRYEALRDLPDNEHRSALKEKAAVSSAKKRSRQDHEREEEEEDDGIAGRLNYQDRDSFSGDEEGHQNHFRVRFNEGENTRHSGPRYSSEAYSDDEEEEENIGSNEEVSQDDVVADYHNSHVTGRSSARQKRGRGESEDKNTSSDKESGKSPKKKSKYKHKGDNSHKDLKKGHDDEDHDGDTAGGDLGMTTNGVGMRTSARFSKIPKASGRKGSSNKKTGHQNGINDDEEVYDDLMSVAETDSLDCNDISSNIDYSYEALTVVTAAVGLSVAVYNMDVDTSLSMLSGSTEVLGEVSKSLADVLLEYAALTA